MGPIYEFQLKSEGGTQVISWSSGTGSIGPACFQIGHRKKFCLEFVISEKLGRLADDELVVFFIENSLLAYNIPVKFIEGQILGFPDFDLKFAGSEWLEEFFPPGQEIPPGMALSTVIYNFEITIGGKTQEVSGSPADFPLKFTIPWGPTKRPGTISLFTYLGVDPPLNLNSDELVVTLGPAFPL